MDILTEIGTHLQNGEEKLVAERTRAAIDQKIPTERILNDGLIAAMNVIGDRFRRHEIFLPEVLLAARAMHAGMDLLKPLLIQEDVPRIGKAVLGTVQGDLHDIGKNLVGIMLKGAGFEVIDLGNDVPPKRFLAAAIENEAPLIGMSTLLTTTMPVMKEVVDRIRAEGLAGKILTIIGGAPVSEDYAREIGADAYAYDGSSAVDRVKRLLDVA